MSTSRNLHGRDGYGDLTLNRSSPGTATASAPLMFLTRLPVPLKGAGNRVVVVGNAPLYVGLTAMAIFVLG